MNDLRERMGESADRKLLGLRAIKRWLNTPKMAKVIDSVDYLAEKYGATVDTYIDSGYCGIYMTLKGLNGLKDESLAALLYSLEHHNAEQVTTDDDADSFARNYRFRWTSSGEGFYGSFAIHVTANFRADSDTCKRVITGYTAPDTTARPIYKLECDGQDDMVNGNGERVIQ